MLKTRLLSAELLATNAKTAAKSQLAAVKTLACRQPLRGPRPAAGGLRRRLQERSRRGRAQRPATGVGYLRQPPERVPPADGDREASRAAGRDARIATRQRWAAPPASGNEPAGKAAAHDADNVDG